MSPAALRVLAVCFFVGGATSLVLQVAWSKQLSYALGTTLYAVTTVVAAFMAGLALGSLLAARWLGGLRRPVRMYAGLQGAIAVCGLLSIPVLRATPGLFAPIHDALGDWPLLFFGARFALVFALLVAPVTLMGMTLPLVAGMFARGRSYARETGLLYGINTLGAVSGTLLAGFVLVPRLGLFATCASVAAADAVVGLVALALHVRGTVARAEAAALGAEGGDGGGTAASAAPPSTEASFGSGVGAGWIGALYALSGAAAIALEVAWFRYLAFVFGPTADAFSVMLATYLAGVGLGSLGGARLARLSRRPLLDLARLQLLLALAVVASTAIFNPVPGLYGRLYWGLGGDPGLLGMLTAQGTVAALVVLPGTLLMGALFPVAVRCFAEASVRGGQAEHTVGRLYGANTVGGIVGSFVAGLWLVPRFGVLETVFAASVVNLLLGAAFAWRAGAAAVSVRLGWTGACAACFGLLVALTPPLDLLALNKGSYLALSNEQGFRHMMLDDYDARRKLLFHEEGVNASVAVTANDGGSGNLFLRVSGKPVADTRFGGRSHLVLLGQLPFLFADDPRTAAVVGFGAGVTTGSSLTHPSIERLDVIELESRIFEAARYFETANGDPLSDPRVRVIVEDGRTWLGYTDERYDVITSDPISPLVAGAANLYTRDFYEIVSARLAPGGVFSQWWETWIPSEPTYKGVLASIAEAFPHVVIFMIYGDSVVLASNEPIALPWSELERRFAQPRVKADFASLQIDTPEQLSTLLLADTGLVRDWLADAPPANSDDRNWLERRMPLELNRRHRENLEKRILERFAPQRAAVLERVLPGIPLLEVVQATAQPRSAVFTHAAPVLTQGFVLHFRREGRDDVVGRIREWVREFERGTAKRLQRSWYTQRVEAARRARTGGDRDEAASLYRELLELPGQPAHREAGTALAEILAAQGRLEEALSVAVRMQREYPADPRAYEVGSSVLERLGRGDDACRMRERGVLLGALERGC